MLCINVLETIVIGEHVAFMLVVTGHLFRKQFFLVRSILDINDRKDGRWTQSSGKRQIFLVHRPCCSLVLALMSMSPFISYRD